MTVVLITKTQQERLLRNGREQREARDRGDTIDFQPVVKLFTPDAQATWLLSELESARGPLNLPVERDLHFTATKTLGEYARDAYAAQRIVA